METIYKFADLSEEAKRVAIQEMYDINLDYDWWEFTYDDAKEVGIEISGFDLSYRGDISGDLLWGAEDVCKALIETHGKDCETHKIAAEYILKFAELDKKKMVLEVTGRMKGEDMYDQLQELDYEYEETADELKKELLNAYLKILQEEYDYKQSEEAIIKTIEANEYEFEEDGSLI